MARYSFLFRSVFSYRKDENDRFFFRLRHKKKQVTDNMLDLLLSCLYHDGLVILPYIITERKVTESNSAEVSFFWAVCILVDLLLTRRMYKSLSHELISQTIFLCKVSSKLLSSGLYSAVQRANSVLSDGEN